MSTRLVIVGAGAFGRDLVSWMGSSPLFAKSSGITSVVFVDDAAVDSVAGVAVVSDIQSFMPAESDVLLCAIGQPNARKHITESLLEKGAKFTTFVHDSVILADRVHLGQGVVLCPYVVVGVDAVLEDHVHVNISSTVSHDSVVGAFSTLSPNCHLAGNVRLGESVFLGISASAIPQICIGDGSTIGAGSMVIRTIPAGVVAYGNPARVAG